MAEEDVDAGVLWRMVGSALATGAAGLSVSLAVARPFVRAGMTAALDPESQLRRSTRAAARGFNGAVVEGTSPAFKSAMKAKDAARDAAVAALPKDARELVDALRREFIEAEKAVYFGARTAYRDVRPTVEANQRRALAQGLEVIDSVSAAAGRALNAAMEKGADMRDGRPAKARARPRPRKARRA